MEQEERKPKTKYLEARIRANEKWKAKNYWKPTIYFPKKLEQEIRENAGESVNAFIVDAVKEKLERMKNGE